MTRGLLAPCFYFAIIAAVKALPFHANPKSEIVKLTTTTEDMRILINEVPNRKDSFNGYNRLVIDTF